MIVRVEGLRAEYSGPREFNLGQDISDVSVPIELLPAKFDLSGYTLGEHVFSGRKLYIVQANLIVEEESLMMAYVPKNAENPPKQEVPIHSYLNGRPFPVVVRWLGVASEGKLRFDLDEKSASHENNLKFIKKYGWYL